jgi:hypothetical protein
MIKQSRKHESEPLNDQAVCGDNDRYHGDLRKGAYLKRRAAYQMQAGSAAPRQAGTLTAKARNPG